MIMTPAGGDPGGRRLKELADDYVFAELPERAEMVEEKRIPAVYTRGYFEAHGWRGPAVVIIFKSAAPPPDVFRFYDRRADAAGWRPIKFRGPLGIPDVWAKTYPDGAYAQLSLTFVSTEDKYWLNGSISTIVQR